MLVNGGTPPADEEGDPGGSRAGGHLRHERDGGRDGVPRRHPNAGRKGSITNVPSGARATIGSTEDRQRHAEGRRGRGSLFGDAARTRSLPTGMPDYVLGWQDVST